MVTRLYLTRPEIAQSIDRTAARRLQCGVSETERPEVIDLAGDLVFQFLTSQRREIGVSTFGL